MKQKTEPAEAARQERQLSVNNCICKVVTLPSSKYSERHRMLEDGSIEDGHFFRAGHFSGVCGSTYRLFAQ